MIYHTYGSTGIKVSAIGFGGMRLDAASSMEDCASLVKAAYDADINYFDTAPGYPRSEEIFGFALKEMNKTRADKPFYVSTKTFAAEPKDVRKELETSLKRMNLDYIDFHHIWCVLSLDAYRQRKNKGVLAEFERLKEEGLIKHICVSTHLKGTDIDELMKDYPFDGVLLGYSAMNFAYRDAGIDAIARRNRGVVVMNPLAGGLIPQNPERFSFVKTREDETAVEGALRFLLNDRRITIALVGFSNEQQLSEAISAVDGFKPIASEKINEIKGSLQECFNELCTSCQYCDKCPEGIPVPKLMDVYNYYMLTGKSEDMLERLKGHWGLETEDDYLSKCTECGECEAVCTQKLPIRERMKFIRNEVEAFLQAEKAKSKKAKMKSKK